MNKDYTQEARELSEKDKRNLGLLMTYKTSRGTIDHHNQHKVFDLVNKVIQQQVQKAVEEKDRQLDTVIEIRDGYLEEIQSLKAENERLTFEGMDLVNTKTALLEDCKIYKEKQVKANKKIEQLQTHLKECNRTHAMLEDLCIEIMANDYKLNGEMIDRITRYNVNDFETPNQ